MDFNEYQTESRKTAKYTEGEAANFKGLPIYPVLGLVGEAGEVAEKMKKIIRDNNGVIDQERKDLLIKEIGDVLWYTAQLCTDLDLSMDDVAQTNLDKLFSRLERGKIQGDGDNR
ncbi:nucleoside triphosphate pyrophosphohydrolase family protein [Patescibacteria group bacterium]|nr:nucleoside triphosphate pyrophosphohydrolase family protein [Patescibacteria group bacterium]MBU1705841.1 nucleoside triphosphate pyrophosphohydrolase family protein [Patescibacteria group bacterium]